MSSNKPVPKPQPASRSNASPDYAGLIRFLIEPFLESPESLSIDCEKPKTKERFWIRLAFEGADKGRVYGRGGRNIQAIRTAIQAVAQAAGQSAYLDIYEEPERPTHRESASGGKSIPRKGLPTRPSTSRSSPRFRS